MLDPATPARSLDPSHATLMRRAATATATEHVPDLLLIERARAGEEQAIEALDPPLRAAAVSAWRTACVADDGARRGGGAGGLPRRVRGPQPLRADRQVRRLADPPRPTSRPACSAAHPRAASNGAAAPTAHAPRRTQERASSSSAIGSLPEVFRTVFVLRVVEGISGIETAASLGVHETTVRTRLYRAHRRLDAETMRRIRALQGLLELRPRASSAW